MRCAAIACLLLVLVCVCPIAADEVIFINGDRLSGKVVSVADGKLTIESWPAGTVTVEMARVRTLSTDEPVEIRFRDGTVVRQCVLSSEEGHFAIEREGVLEPQMFALADVVAINPPPRPKPRWEGDVTAGVTLTRSNTDTESANLSVSLVRSGDADRIAFDAALLYGRQEDPATGERTTTEDSWSAEAKYDYFLSERLFVYAGSRVEQDEIRDLDLRLIAGPGVGREWVKRQDLSFRTEAGLSWLYEDFAGETETNEQVTARLAYYVAKSFGDTVELVHELAWYPALEDLGDYFLTTGVDVRVSLTETMFGDFKVVFDYDSTPAAGVDEESLKSTLGLGLRF